MNKAVNVALRRNSEKRRFSPRTSPDSDSAVSLGLTRALALTSRGSVVFAVEMSPTENAPPQLRCHASLIEPVSGRMA